MDAVTQPLSDLNLRNRDIPLILTLAQAAPYDISHLKTCDDLRFELSRLDEVLGPDADEARERGGLVNKGLQAGGDFLGGMIPFRGIVRRISGAKAQEARWRLAIYGGVARRSFLKGYLAARPCDNAADDAARSARDILGMSPSEE
ncbi:MAG: hypothetical protein WBA51_17175 [Erythrobacter sp.]